jgi:hypothetical protein
VILPAVPTNHQNCASLGRDAGLKLTNLQVQCADDGCLILLIGRDIPVYELDFDEFATEKGFAAGANPRRWNSRPDRLPASLGLSVLAAHATDSVSAA